MSVKERYNQNPNNNTNEKNDHNLLYLTNKLRELSVKNEILGYLIGSIFIGMIVIMAMGIFYPEKTQTWIQGALSIITCVFLIDVAFIAAFQNNIKKANMFFDELADNTENNKTIYSNNIDYKINVKRYLQSTELPLIQGKYGSTVFFLLSLVFFVFSIFYLFFNR
jgi:hypothetical protein